MMSTLGCTLPGTMRGIEWGYQNGDPGARLTVSKLRRHLGSPEDVLLVNNEPGTRGESLSMATAMSLFATALGGGRVLGSLSFARACSISGVNETRIENLLGARDLASVSIALRPIIKHISGAGIRFDYAALSGFIYALCTDELAEQAVADFIHDYTARPSKGTKP